MQLQRMPDQPLSDRERAYMMEQVIMEIRRMWFGGEQEKLAAAVCLKEISGQMAMLVDGTPAEVADLANWAAKMNVYVVDTSYSRPEDLGARLRKRGFKLVQRHAEYVWNGRAAETAPRGPARRGLLSLLRRREPVAVQVAPVDLAGLSDWNAVCWRAFGARCSESAALAEKAASFRAMGERGRWYLASVAGRPVGTAILYQGEEAAQVLAVGTLGAFRGRGVATAVMERVLRDWQHDGRGFLFLDATPGSNAERLYLRLGFSRAYFRDIYAPPGP
ncbi:MAG TPA: GNAT family N-acetyltransferase [Symbiobacteriaceae bacterium]|jgi:ribosomal protein S18 acetylase RimI-like enzyme